MRGLGEQNSGAKKTRRENGVACQTARKPTEVAMSKRTRPKPTEQYADRLDAEKAALRRHYCNVFKFWRSCRLPRCRKLRCCSGDAKLCLESRGREIPHHEHWQARQQLLCSLPANAEAVKRAACELMPCDLVC
jgi:hypothetical protein